MIRAQTEEGTVEAALSRASAWIRAARPEQWSKNVLVFAALVFGLELFEPDSVIRAGLAFVAFCAVSSGVYLINDLRDLDRDRLHPAKRHRPIAAGLIAPRAAAVAAVALSGGAVALGLVVAPAFAVIVVGYLALNAIYTLALKDVVLLDAIVIAVGFVLRAVGGAAAIHVSISPWLVVCTFMAALFLALGKRRAEIGALAEAVAHRPVSRSYTLELLDQLMTIVVAASILSYCLYTLSPEVREKFGVDHLEVTVPFVVYGLFRYLYLVRVSDRAQNPVQAIVTDRPIVLTVLLWGALVIGLLYLQGGPFR